jgi:hypothetical protein
MKCYKYIKNYDNGNIIKTEEEYHDNNTLKSINNTIYDCNKNKIISHNKYYYDDGVQLHFEIIINYKDNYTYTNTYYECGTLKGESKTIDNIYVLHKKYNMEGKIIKEWKTELPQSK